LPGTEIMEDEKRGRGEEEKRGSWEAEKLRS
jgi:hypothetical protein